MYTRTVYHTSKKEMKLYEQCFDYRLSSDDVEAIDSTWDDELTSFINDYVQGEDFMEQLSRHNLFILVCMLDLKDDEYIEKCYEIYSFVSSDV